MKQLTGIISLILVVAAVLMAVWFLPDGPAEPESQASVNPPSQVEVIEPDRTPEPEPVSAPAVSEEAVEEEQEDSDLPPGMTEEEAARQRRIVELRDAALKRWDETVEADQIDPEQIEPAVRKMFKTFQLEPVFDPENGREGYVDGMVISRLVSTNPVAKAGFENGDHVTRFNGQPLQDPALYAHLFANLGTRFEICVARGNGEYCRMIDLNAN